MATAEESCPMSEVCGLVCPEETPPPSKGFAAAVLSFAVLFCIIGLLTFFSVKGKTENFFVAGRSLPLWIITATLASQSLDSNALLGNVDLSYKFHFWDGCVLPIGLGLSLILNGIFFARKINDEKVLTLPDVYAKRYGKLVEILVSITTIVSFLFLLAGNLVGMGAILGYLLNIDDPAAAVWISMILILLYTACGGLFSVAYTDCIQAAIGWFGCLFAAFYLINNKEQAPPPSIGFEGYIYPDNIGDGGVCDMYSGVPCTNDPSLCCYNTEIQTAGDNGAYPFGDKRVFNNQMTDPYSLTPFPNAILFNWATIFVLGFGNLAALDFQARCMAAKTPKIATIGCIIAGFLTFLVGIPFSYLGAITRVLYGPDSSFAVFEPDTCSEILLLPTCAMWVPDADAFIKVLTHNMPSFLGGWCLIGIVAASMSTADGAILAMGTVLSNNLLRHVKFSFITKDTLILAARLSMIPFAVAAAAIATTKPGETGTFLIVAFDVTLASVVVPLFGCFYTKIPRPAAALFSILSGAITRIIMQFELSKDGSLLPPYGGAEFLDYGPAASAKVPPFIDDADPWDPSTEPCDQSRFSDYSGADSLASAAVSLVVFVLIQFLEREKSLDDSWLVSWSWMRPCVIEADVDDKHNGAMIDDDNFADDAVIVSPSDVGVE